MSGAVLTVLLAVLAVAGLAAAVGAAGVAGLAGAWPIAAGRTDLPPPMRLACARVGAANAAMVTAITEAVVRKEVFTKSPGKRRSTKRGPCDDPSAPERVRCKDIHGGRGANCKPAGPVGSGRGWPLRAAHVEMLALWV